MQVYADVVFAINLVMDIFILLIVNRLRARHAPLTRVVAAGFVMALMYCMLVFVPELRPYLNIFAAVFIMAAGVVIAFSPNGLKEFALLTALGHIAAFALGGVGMALFYFTDIGNVVGNMLGYSVRNFSVKLLAASTCTFYIILRLFVGWAEKTRLKKQALYPVTISYNELDINLTALVDTGNSLHDPISNSPVLVAEFSAVKEFLPDCIKLVFYEKKENDLGSWIGLLDDPRFAGRIRMIPYASLGTENGMLLGFRPDKVEIVYERKKDVVNDVIVAIYNLNLSNEGRYQGLLSPELVRN